MNGFDADDARYLFFPDRYVSSDDHFFVYSADAVKFQISVVGDIGDNESDFVHMSRQHHFIFRTVSSLFESQYIPQRIDRVFTETLDMLDDIIPDSLLSSGGSVQLT